MKKPKSKFMINFEYAASRLGIELAKFIPLKICYFLNEICCRIFYYCDKKHRNRTKQHILHSGITDSEKEARRIALQSFINLGKVAIEFVKLHNILTPGNMHEYITYNISEKARKALLDPRGTVCASAHYGNWEITGLSLSILFRPIVSIGRKMDNPKLNNYIFRKRGKFRQEIYPKEEAVRHMLKGLKQQKLLGILIDQHPGNDVGIKSDFFHHPTMTHDTPATLHVKTGAPLMLIVTRRLDSDFHFELLIRGPFEVEPSGNKHEDIKRLTIKINDEFEKIIRECPEQWLWAHRRWLDKNRGEYKG
ncbi:MAG: lysophospholipid acyltransferase family protein [Victivallales bacterium]|nr:lysophospholipid acyltransferase family protein [Victivallales bacterium]MCF7889330.1 lysophospholipid acyltransferase family protein [Victivallales bacterium]